MNFDNKNKMMSGILNETESNLSPTTVGHQSNNDTLIEAETAEETAFIEKYF